MKLGKNAVEAQVHYHDYESKHRKIQIQFTFENKNKIHNLVE